VKPSRSWNFKIRKANEFFFWMGGETMPKNNPIEYTGKVLDQRNDLTGPDDSGKGSYPERPKHVPIQAPANNKGK
jgi:hypothetical protein